MDIVFSSCALLNLKPLTTVNHKTCYEIHTNESEECPIRYLFTPETTVFIALKHDSKIHIFNLKNDGVFPDQFKEYIDQIRPKLQMYFDDRSQPRVSFTIHDELNNKNPYDFAIIKKTSSRECEKFISLSNAKSIVSHLNDALQLACPGFYLNIDYITAFPPNSSAALYSGIYSNSYFHPQIVLCLFTGNDCVSSITIKIRGNRITIDSKTDERYEGRKFNTLLRAVAIILSKSLSETAERLTSDAANVISALLMIKRFNAIAEEGDISKNTISADKLDKVIKDYFSHRGNMETYVELNDENIAHATTVFNETIQRMNCEPLQQPGGQGGSKKNRKKYTKKNRKGLNPHRKLKKTIQKSKR